MRINVYNEEIMDRVEVVTKEANTVTFTGIRLFVGKPFEHTPGDEDSSAVTFWYSDEYTRRQLRVAFKKAMALLGEE